MKRVVMAAGAMEGGGNARFGRNVAFAWGGYMVNVVTGFIVPRLISDRLGQEVLGIWDFSWSLVCYFGLVQLGIGSAVGRSVAQHRAAGDTDGLNRAVSTIAVFQRAVGWLAFVAAALAAYWLVPWFGERLGPQAGTARLLVFIQGAEVAASISLGVYGSVITGCHRWDMHNTVSAIAYLVAGGGMVGALGLGLGLPWLAGVHAVVMTGSEWVRRGLVRRVCPELVVAGRLACVGLLKEQLRYGLKTLIPSLANLFSNQALSLLVAAFLGPSSLAVFSRSRSLMTNVRTLGAKFGMIVVPIASELQAGDDVVQLRKVLLETSGVMSGIALPAIFFISVAGDVVMRFWMGQAYVLPWLIPILGVGTYVGVVHEPVWCLLAGIDRHGRVAAAKLAASLVAAGALGTGLGLLDWGLLEVALCMVLPQLLVEGVMAPRHACKVVGLGVGEFYRAVCVRPMLRMVPLGAGLLMLAELPLSPPVWLVAVCLVAVTCGGLFYLAWLIPQAWPLRFEGGRGLGRHGAGAG